MVENMGIWMNEKRGNLYISFQIDENISDSNIEKISKILR